MKSRVLFSLLIAAGGVLFAGCAREPVMPPPIGDLTADLEAEFAATAPPPPLAGTPRELRALSRDQLVASVGAARATRSNPFALFGEEIRFQTGIRYENILGNMSQYEGTAFSPPMFVPPPVVTPVEMIEPEAQPYRRLSGVYFGDTVSAIIQMEDGKSYLIYPGSRVGDTEWYVESIDAEKATLVRAGNKIPKRIIVRLETPPFGGGGGGGGGNPGGGAPAGGGGRMGGGPGPAPGGGIGN